MLTPLPHWVKTCLQLARVFSITSCLTSAAFSAEVNSPLIGQFLTKYCIECHGEEKQKGDRFFHELILPARNEDTLYDLKDMMDQIHLGEMPPSKSPQPPQAEQDAFLAEISKALDQGRAALSSTGSKAVLRRLNRREYINTIGDLFGLNMAAFDPTTQFPRDQSEEHMDNLGDVLQTSSYLLDQYLEAADVIVEKAFALHEQPPEQTWVFNDNFKPQGELSGAHRKFRNRYIQLYECIDTSNHEGGYGFIKDFENGVPADGFYEIKVLAHARNRNHPYDPKIHGIDSRQPFRLGVVPGDIKAGSLYLPQRLQPMLAEYSLSDAAPKWYTMKVWLDAGHTPRFVFPNGPRSARSSWGAVAKHHQKKNIGIVEARIFSVSEDKIPHIRIHEIQIRGPLADSQQAGYASHIVGHDDLKPNQLSAAIRSFADLAYRRPATTDEIERLVAVAKHRISMGHSLTDGLKTAFKAALCSPAFVYLSQETSAPSDDTKKQLALSPYALASRLSYFLWSSMPDAELLGLAKTGELTKPEVILSQTRRLLADPRSDAFITGFLDSWLNLRALGTMPPDRNDFETYYSKGLENAFKLETQYFTRDLILHNASTLNYLDSNYSYLNQALATHYGLGDISPPAEAHRFRKVTLKEPQRGGLLGMGSVLTITANGIETSPVIRGVFLLENILGTPPPPPPDDVPAIDPDVRGAQSMRELLSKHRESPNCFGCHQKIDPLGFALENFDPIGGWRTKYNRRIEIDTSGELASGEAFSGVAELKKVLLTRKDFFSRMLTERLLTYACGRRMEVSDDPTVDKIVSEMPKYNHGLRSLIESVTTSDAFLNR